MFSEFVVLRYGRDHAVVVNNIELDYFPRTTNALENLSVSIARRVLLLSID